MRKLYGYFRSSAAYRARIALNLKGLDYERAIVHLTKGGGEQFASEYRALNAQSLVPVLQVGGDTLTQSVAIIEYLDEVYPEPTLLPKTPIERARVRSIALSIACEIHPLNNLRVLRYLINDLKVTEAQKDEWYRHWIVTGLAPLEMRLVNDPATGRFCHGDAPGLADICLVPQLANARRFNIALDDFPTLVRIEQACMVLKSFQDAAPSAQPDAE
ncbi:MAG: maleylacetoacetate isomerase [Burkholderiales bacterium]